MATLRGMAVPRGGLGVRRFYSFAFPYGCFLSTIKNDNIRVCDGHDFEQVIASTGSKTARFVEDQTGLWCEFTPIDTQLARDLIEQVRTGVRSELSINFASEPEDEYWSDGGDGRSICTIKKAKLLECSIVTEGAVQLNGKPGTSVKVTQLSARSGLTIPTKQSVVSPRNDLARLQQAIRQIEQRPKPGCLTLAESQRILQQAEQGRNRFAVTTKLSVFE